MAITSAMVSDLATVEVYNIGYNICQTNFNLKSDNNICHQTNTQVTTTSATENQGHNIWPHVNSIRHNNSGQNICHKKSSWQ